MHTADHANHTIKAVIAGVTSAVIGTATLTGVDPGTALYISGLVSTAATAVIALVYAIKRLRAGEPVEPVQGDLPLA